MSSKSKRMVELIDGAKKSRAALQGVYKDFLKLGRKVKYIEPVGELVAGAINDLIDAEMSLKEVIDAGNIWNNSRESLNASFNPYGESATSDPAYEILDRLRKAIGLQLSNRDGWWYKKHGGSVLFNVWKPSYGPPERGELMELRVRIDKSLLSRNGTIVVAPEWEVTDTIELEDWAKAAREVNKSEKMSRVVRGAFDAFERKEQVVVPDWIRRHMHNYVMKNAWNSATKGMSMRGTRYQLVEK